MQRVRQLHWISEEFWYHLVQAVSDHLAFVGVVSSCQIYITRQWEAWAGAGPAHPLNDNAGVLRWFFAHLVMWCIPLRAVFFSVIVWQKPSIAMAAKGVDATCFLPMRWINDIPTDAFRRVQWTVFGKVFDVCRAWLQHFTFQACVLPRESWLWGGGIFP